MKNDKSILLIGANFRAMFFVAQKLHQLGYIIDVVDFEEIPLGSSKYIRHYECVQNKNCVSALKEAVFALLNNSCYKAIIPINDLGLMLCKECYTELSNKSKVIMPQLNVIDFAFDKYKLISFSKEYGFEDANIKLLAHKSDFSGYESNGIRKIIKATNSKRFVDDKILSYSTFSSDKTEELKNHFNYTDYPILIQDFINGEELGFNFYARNGEIVCSYFDRNVVNNFGEQSIIRRTAVADKGIETKLINLVRAIGWNGVGMFDLIVKDGEPYILELNGRFWASIDLSDKIGCGIWEEYAQDNLGVNLNDKIKTTKKATTTINFFAATKEILSSILHFKIEKKTFILIGYILKSFVSPRTYIQEKLLCDYKFYLNWICSYIKK